MPTEPRDHSVVAVYQHHSDAEAAVKALQASGLDLRQFSILGKDVHTEEHALGVYSLGDRLMFWGARGAFWGSMWGLMFGSSLFLLPAIGPVVVMGPLVGLLVSALEGAAVGGAAGVLGAALTSLGLPKESVVRYELEVKAGKFLVVGSGSALEIETAKSVLARSGGGKLEEHSPPPGFEPRPEAQHLRPMW